MRAAPGGTYTRCSGRPTARFRLPCWAHDLLASRRPRARPTREWTASALPRTLRRVPPDALSFDELENRLTAHVSERMLELADLAPGTRVLDLACGRGEPSLRAARRVGPGGEVLGLDVAERSLEVARRRAARDGLSHARFTCLDIERADEAGTGFDVALSRWGLVAAREPVRALEATARALKPGGRLVLAVWCEPARIPWWSVPRAVTERFAELPPRPPDAPSPFRYAAQEKLEADLARAGFDVEATEELHTSVVESADVDGFVDWVRVVLSPWADAVPVERRAAWEQALREAFAPHRSGNTWQLDGVARLVRATHMETR